MPNTFQNRSGSNLNRVKITKESNNEVFYATIERADTVSQGNEGTPVNAATFSQLQSQIDEINTVASNAITAANAAAASASEASNLVSNFERDLLYDEIYPIGTIYLTVVNMCPASEFGGSWVLLSADKALWTTTTAGTGAGEIPQALPNITGTLRTPFYDLLDYTHYGAFSVEEENSNSVITGMSSNTRHKCAIKFNANNGATASGIYKDNCTTVQPPAIKVFAWRRIG